MNQDSMFFDETQGLVVVADGIGGRKGGEVASRMAVEGIRQAYLESEVIRHEEVAPFLSSAFDSINTRILEKGQSDPDITGMGTTLNALLFVGDRLYIAYVGDSRSYLYYQGQLWQLTIDHSLRTFVDRGWLPKTHLQPGIRDSALVRSLGLTQRCEIDLYDMQLKQGEIFITCSDGLSGMVEDKRIASIVRHYENQLEKIPKALVAEANKNGGKDNVTVVAARVVGG